MSNNRLFSREHLKLVKKYLFEQHQQNFSCDDDMHDNVVKKIKNKINKNKFTLVSVGAETNVVCILKRETGYIEKVGEIGNSGYKVGT